jgi:UDP-2,3-diacylglucosamine pyrophosphatase LpxH
MRNLHGSAGEVNYFLRGRAGGRGVGKIFVPKGGNCVLIGGRIGTRPCFARAERASLSSSSSKFTAGSSAFHQKITGRNMSTALVPVPSESLPHFDELYVISDLHLGGPRGFQIFNSGVELARLIRHLRAAKPRRRVALLINGDFVDFLAERPSKHFDPAGAAAKLTRITEDPAFSDTFEALREFVAARNRHLVLNLGNHDLELALPWVRAHLLTLLAGDNDAARGRITLAFDGAGFLCRVGGAEVMCVHGNEVDDWNLANYEVIRRFGMEVLQGRPVESWIPNAGSQLVIDVMNEIKGRFPFVDLLKPETSGVLPILYALAPEQGDKLNAIAATFARLGFDKLRRMTGFLGAEDEEEAAALPASAALALPDAAASTHTGPNGLPAATRREVDGRKLAARMLAEAEERMHKGVDPLSLVAADRRGQYLGWTEAVMKLVRGESKPEVLREALEKLREDRSFDFGEEDVTFKRLDERISGNAEFVVAGHTHLERALRRKVGRGYYFNSGTWARLVRLEPEVLADAQRFAAVYEVFGAGSMEKLDDFPGLVLRRLTVVAVCEESGQTYGELQRVALGAAEPVLAPVAGSRFATN